ncbi:juvenile hormone esterase [Orussus abietinus]|uniref:juvenile hormone esterase n=1 Tax=Orussus abietinus TaxID=222816 RepID=UPI0006268731|nr:juvenile hormone esterase [Orussus abietinus]XP_012279171.1 juvenile hormone esterase [Orussus abietinus]
MYIIVALFFLAFATAHHEPPVTVNTAYGAVQGRILTSKIRSVPYAAFTGIPFAQPPVGVLRFKPPVRIQPWQGVFNASVEGTPCIQVSPFDGNTLIGSEDCLYLNVFTPQTKFQARRQSTRSASTARPVMVWIYGGGFTSGYADHSVFGPDFIIEEDVLLVTFNYRLGALGFMSLNVFNATGNAGLKDQNLALQWVQENIRFFGGDPARVTIFGQSAGGASVDTHILSEKSRGLFSGAITMSASILNPWAFHRIDEAVSKAFSLARELRLYRPSIFNFNRRVELREEILRKLMDVPARDIVLATEKLSLADPPFRPTIEYPEFARKEDIFLSDCPLRIFTSGNFAKVPFMLGFTSDETAFFGGVGNVLFDMFRAIPNTQMVPILDDILPPFLTDIINLPSMVISDLSTEVLRQLVNDTSEVHFISGIDQKERLLHELSPEPVFYYRFTVDTEDSAHRVLYNVSLDGAAHSDDLPYIFYVSAKDLSRNASPRVRYVRDRIVSMWTNFAKFRNPTPKGAAIEVSWPEVGDKGNQLQIDEPLLVTDRAISRRVEMIIRANGRNNQVCRSASSLL